MRSKLIIVATVVASLVLASQMASADPVQEQLRLMEQRMAEMEDRLQETSTELQEAKSIVNQQQALLSDAGFVDESDKGIRSAVGHFLQQVEISGVMAASYNHRFLAHGDDNLENVGLFRHDKADTFAFDQFWLTFDKSPTSEDRAGFHIDLVYGETARAQDGGGSDVLDASGNSIGTAGSDDFLVFNAYASYLMPHGDSGIRFDLGKLSTPLGAEVLQTNKNMNITQGLVWGLQPVAHTGIQASHQFGDHVGLTVGVVNDVYSDTSWDDSREKAYYGQLAYSADMFGISVGAIVGKDSATDYRNDNGNACTTDDQCNTSVFNVVATANPSENVSLWADYTWVHSFGNDIDAKGDVHGIAVAGRVGITESTGIATRFEYVRMNRDFSRSMVNGGGEIGEVFSATVTGDHALTDCLTFRIEGRVDRNLTNNALFAVGGTSGATNARKVQLVGLAELAYGF